MRKWMVASVAAKCLIVCLVSVPTFGQVDLAGTWDSRSMVDHMERGSGPFAVAYWGIPLSDAGRRRALSYNSSVLAVLERQCLYYSPMYLLNGPQGIIFSTDLDPISGIPIAVNIQSTIDRPPLKIWLDGRVEPSKLAAHPPGGFIKARWERGTLIAGISHIPESYLVRNGVPSSDQAKMTLFITRHGDLLSVTGVFEDPIYLTEPYPLSQVLILNPDSNEGSSAAWRQSPCTPEIDVPDYAHDQVPSYLPGQNPSLNEMTHLYNIPLDGVLGGAQTMYPEFQSRILTAGYAPPGAYCKQYCCGWIGGVPPSKNLRCPKASGE
jgi:hypothetical protein